MKMHWLACLFLACCTSNCTQGPSRSTQNNEIPQQGKSNERTEPKEQANLMETEIRKASLQLGIESLIDSPQNNGLHIRIWMGFGLTYPRCFDLRYINEMPEASFLTLTTTKNQSSDEKAETTVNKIALAAPKSGWNEFEKLLRRHGIESPLKLKPETNYVPNPDGQIIAIETKEGSAYDMVFFHVDNRSEDALKSLSVCRSIEHEFNAPMNCP